MEELVENFDHGVELAMAVTSRYANTQKNGLNAKQGVQKMEVWTGTLLRRCVYLGVCGLEVLHKSLPKYVSDTMAWVCAVEVDDLVCEPCASMHGELLH